MQNKIWKEGWDKRTKNKERRKFGIKEKRIRKESSNKATNNKKGRLV